MRTPHFITILLVIFLVWGSLFITILNQDSRLRTVASRDQSLALQNDKIINQLKTNIAKSSAARNLQLDTILQDMQCIGDYFAITDHTSYVLSNLNQCTIIPSTSGGSAGGTKSG